MNIMLSRVNLSVLFLKSLLIKSDQIYNYIVSTQTKTRILIKASWLPNDAWLCFFEHVDIPLSFSHGFGHNKMIQSRLKTKCCAKIFFRRVFLLACQERTEICVRSRHQGMWINGVTMVTPMMRFYGSVSLLKVSQKRGVTLYIGLTTLYITQSSQSPITWSPIKSYNTHLQHSLQTCLFLGRQSTRNFHSRGRRFVSLQLQS